MLTVRSDAVKFKALPGVCIRVFDIRFGSKGLSIRHFARFSPDEASPGCKPVVPTLTTYRQRQSLKEQLPLQVSAALWTQPECFIRTHANTVAKFLRVDGSCPSDRGHFVPKKLAVIVKSEINKRFGGLKTEHQQL
ncbi:LOW QUALITY PROTEIN: hypothetical protein PHMEG_00021102 [Phytophthora megakarya]|uniref:Uncharacterized protein n=1 Tax=Phytophthora megakarya TaxID=4795 RepID=A0A225VQ11_9STRA|nr:LOW QUALITY PROTEIN: hypothetical protein PHMEG_00021102 [Phytophthora megakarya]